MTSQQSFKNKVKIHGNEAAFSWLKNEQQNLKKINPLSPGVLDPGINVKPHIE